MEEFEQVKDVVQDSEPQSQCAMSGRNMPHKHPDVECLVMLGKRFPTTSSSFVDVCNGKDWVKLDVVVLNVGPPGYASVPYTMNKKEPVDKNSLQPIYERQGNKTVFYSFQKGKTPRDKGIREGIGENGSGWSLEVGTSLSFFYNQTKFEEDGLVSFEDGQEKCNVLEEGTLCLLQIAGGNVDAVEAKRFLKAKRIHVLSHANSIINNFNVVHSFPASLEEYDDLMGSNKMACVSSLLGSKHSKYLTIGNTLNVDGAFVTYDEQMEKYILSNCKATMTGDVEIKKFELERALRCSDTSRCVKLANIAIKMSALYIFVKLSVDYSTGDSVYTGLRVHVMASKFLGLDGHKVNVQKTDGGVFWTSESFYVDVDKVLGFEIESQDHTCTDAWYEGVLRKDASFLLSDGFNGKYKPLKIYMISSTLLNAESEEETYHSRELLIKIQFRSVGITGNKRRRIEFAVTSDKRDCD